MTTRDITSAIRQIGGAASPPQIRRHMNLAPPHPNTGDVLVIFLEQLRSEGVVCFAVSDSGDLLYALPPASPTPADGRN